MARLCEFPGLIVPQAGPGGSPAFPYREAIQKKSGQGAGRTLTVGYPSARFCLKAA